VKKRRIIKALRRARASGCSCVTFEPREVCAACFASDLLGDLPPPRRVGFADRVVKLIAGNAARLARGPL
jgi:hypothetical protein